MRALVITGGRHIPFQTLAVTEQSIKLGFWLFLFSAYTNLLIKISIASMLLRIKQEFWWRLSLWFLIGLCFTVGISATITQCLQCRPVSSFWHISGRLGGNCWSQETLVNISYGYGCEFTKKLFRLVGWTLTRCSILYSHGPYCGLATVSSYKPEVEMHANLGLVYSLFDNSDALATRKSSLPCSWVQDY